MYAAKVLVVSLRPPAFSPPSFFFSLHGNNLVIDDVKADEVQQLEKPQVKKKNGWVFSFYGCTLFITIVWNPLQHKRIPLANLWWKDLNLLGALATTNQSPFFIETSLQNIFICHTFVLEV